MSGDDMRNEREDRATKELEQEKRIALEVENRLKKLEIVKQNKTSTPQQQSTQLIDEMKFLKVIQLMVVVVLEE